MQTISAAGLLVLIVVSAFYWHSQPSPRHGDLAPAIHAFLRKHVEGTGAIVVVGVVDEFGSSVISCGERADNADQDVNGDTIFEIGSLGKTFTTLLLCGMVERGEMKLDGTTTKYLPRSVQMPSRHGKEITLRHLATHYSGLPSMPDNLDAKRADNPYADYTVEKLHDFLGHYELTRDPGDQPEYSNLGMGLLGHLIALKAGQSYEELVVERICRPLKMESTRIRLSPEQKARLVSGHNQFGETVPHWDIAVLEGAGALRSTANDLLKYVAANAGLTSSSLTPLMKDAHHQSLAWYRQKFRHGEIVGHSGGTAGHSAYVGFDEAAGRGVVVLANRKDFINVEEFGTFLLKSEWWSLNTIPVEAVNIPSPRKPRAAIKLSPALLDACVGEYEFAPNAIAQLPEGMKVRVWREGTQLLCEARGKNVLQGRFEIYPQSQTVFFDRISSTRSTFRKNSKGIVTTLILSPEGLPDFTGKNIYKTDRKALTHCFQQNTLISVP